MKHFMKYIFSFFTVNNIIIYTYFTDDNFRVQTDAKTFVSVFKLRLLTFGIPAKDFLKLGI